MFKKQTIEYKLKKLQRLEAMQTKDSLELEIDDRIKQLEIELPDNPTLKVIRAIGIVSIIILKTFLLSLTFVFADKESDFFKSMTGSKNKQTIEVYTE